MCIYFLISVNNYLSRVLLLMVTFYLCGFIVGKRIMKQSRFYCTTSKKNCTAEIVRQNFERRTPSFVRSNMITLEDDRL